MKRILILLPMLLLAGCLDHTFTGPGGTCDLVVKADTTGNVIREQIIHMEMPCPKKVK